MILEHALLHVDPALSEEFEKAFGTAKSIISAVPGFIRLHLSHCMESPQQYLLLVEWESLEAHTVGFRQSDGYQRWRELLHHFYDPFPVAEHYETVVEEGSPT
ncbi:antibiotic biosynthesis monooxygenase [Rhodococcus sp. AD45-ID]|uniref:antibiotic biosynthesis monooxygenase family protein n=1 Tax=unclassified Rhodococcus (in: high G+C Gram-positive bacteria) TaxID=192944 RepID=UPI0005D2F149|nr:MULTISPECIES: antibiotic biosynthesis monooxygenase [unclassified Rhodococcus (in: high G+C Gram-positive bacteria)]KJF19930.1 Antibiotic biosynthesis monooxygenase [Rhodococcus sp. AD45]PSR41065.1 antibiotic biosynthesis monooxygenase [Rhodococcus sp. AD45-ID]